MIVGTLVALACVAPPAGDVDGETSAKLHGEARLGLGFGMVMEDPVATLAPALELDLRDHVPLRIGVGAPLRLRMADRAPDQGDVLRLEEWNEVGDFIAILERVHYVDDYVFGTHGELGVDLRVGTLGRVQLGHGSLVRGFANSLDLDRRRSGADLALRVQGELLDQRAGLDLGVVATDLAGMQIFGGRLGLDWAGAGVGFSAAADPTAPHGLARDPSEAGRFALDDRGGLVAQGDRGVLGLGVDLSYAATDDARWLVKPYLDLDLFPGVGKGLHLGVLGELVVGARRRVRLGLTAEMTVGDGGYDPAYFDVFYLAQRWQMEFVASPDDRPADLGLDEPPKHAFVDREDLSGFGGHGAFRFAHAAGAFAELGYGWRPGPLGGTSELRAGVDLERVDLSLLYAHRGRHGWEVHHLAGTLAAVDLRVPIIKYLDAVADAGWLFAVRPDEAALANTGDVGTLTAAGRFNLGVAGKIPW